MHDYEDIINKKYNLDINKVILFTKKEKVPPTFKALSAIYRDKIRFLIVHVRNKEKNYEEFKNIS